jgi:hypothetical protein
MTVCRGSTRTGPDVVDRAPPDQPDEPDLDVLADVEGRRVRDRWKSLRPTRSSSGADSGSTRRHANDDTRAAIARHGKLSPGFHRFQRISEAVQHEVARADAAGG